MIYLDEHMDFDKRIAYINEMVEAKGYSQDYVDLLKDCFEWADANQLFQIFWGLEHDLDVSIYAKPEYDYAQMQAIRLGLVQGVDVSKYADSKFGWEQMEQIREQLEAKKN